MSVVPLTMFFAAMSVTIDASTVLLAVMPLSHVASAVAPREFSVALLFAMDVFADVLPSVDPKEAAPAVHLVIVPLALIGAIVVEEVLSMAVKLVVDEVADVG